MTAEKENAVFSPHLIDGIWDLAGTICDEILDDKEHENQEQISFAIQSFVNNEKFFPKCKCNNKIVKLATEMLKHKDCMLVIYNNEVTLHTGQGAERKYISCKVNDDEKINKVIEVLKDENGGLTNEP